MQFLKIFTRKCTILKGRIEWNINGNVRGDKMTWNRVKFNVIYMYYYLKISKEYWKSWTEDVNIHILYLKKRFAPFDAQLLIKCAHNYNCFTHFLYFQQYIRLYLVRNLHYVRKHSTKPNMAAITLFYKTKAEALVSLTENLDHLEHFRSFRLRLLRQNAALYVVGLFEISRLNII